MLFLGVSSLNANIIDQMQQPVYTLCAHQCAVHRFCVAINYKEIADENEPNCQLTNTTKHNFDESVNKTDGVWTFRLVSTGRSLMVRV